MGRDLGVQVASTSTAQTATDSMMVPCTCAKMLVVLCVMCRKRKEEAAKKKEQKKILGKGRAKLSFSLFGGSS